MLQIDFAVAVTFCQIFASQGTCYVFCGTSSAYIEASSPRQNSSQRYCLNSCFALYICLQLHLKARISFTPAAGMDAIQSNFCLRACGRRKKNMTNARKYPTTFFVDVGGPCLIHGIFAPRSWVPAWYAYAGAFTVFPFLANKRWSQHNVLSLTKTSTLKTTWHAIPTDRPVK